MTYAVFDDAPVALSRLYEPDVELVCVRRDHRQDLRQAALAAIRRGTRIEARGVFPAGDRAAFSAATAPIGQQDPALGVMLDDMFECSELLAELLGCAAIGYRLQTLHHPMCPRFHVDRIPCRLLVTYGGPGTEWITERWLDRSAMETGGPDSYPVIEGGRHGQLPEGAIAVLKGSAWSASVAAPGAAYGGVVHRSPAAPQGRMLMSLDPLGHGD